MWRRFAAVLVAAVCCTATLPVSGASGEAPRARPSAQELWKTYPLHQGDAGSATTNAQDATRTTSPAAASDTRRTTSSRGTRVAAADGGGAPVLLVLAGAIAVAAAAGAAWWRLRQPPDREEAASPTPRAVRDPLSGPLRLAPVAASAGPPEPRSVRAEREPIHLLAAAGGEGDAEQRRLGRLPTAAAPPDATRPWTAEITWRTGRSGPRFAALARDADGAEVVLAQSAPVPWPPADADAVERLGAAADDLARALRRAGWEPLARGEAWYARRFAWTPAPAPTRAAPAVSEPPAVRPEPSEPQRAERRTGPPAPPSPVPESADSGWFKRRPWPEGTEELWRCELRWSAGWARSRFEAVAQEPHGGKRLPVATSEPFSWMLHADPAADDAEVRDAVGELSELLLADGWTEVEPGRRWYARRYVWRRDGAPPTHDQRRSASEAGRRR